MPALISDAERKATRFGVLFWVGVAIITLIGKGVHEVFPPWWAEWRWESTVGKDLTRAQQLMLKDRNDEAISEVRRLLAKYPNDPGLFYTMAGLYYGSGQWFGTYVSLHAYMVVAHDRWEWLTPRASDVRRRFYTYYQVLQDNDSSEKNLAELQRVFEAAPAAWKKPLRAYALQEVLTQPAFGDYDALGFPTSEKVSGVNPRCTSKSCAEIFKDSDFVEAATTGVLRVTLSNDCCTMKLDDVDLADDAMSRITQKFVEKYGAAFSKNEQYAMEFLAARERMLIKERFAYSFCYSVDRWHRLPEPLYHR